LDAQQSILFLEKIRIIADRLRAVIEPYIAKVEKNHHALWGDYYGSRISFADGGMSRVVSVPGVTPTGLRVGIYTVVPGEVEPEQREFWSLQSFMIGDILNDRSIIDEDDADTDEKRIQEAARYLAESISTLRYVNEKKVDAFFVHGPVQNKFETYDELDPYFIPGLSERFLASMGLTEDLICSLVEDMPRNRNRRKLWSAAIPVYAAVQKLISKIEIPVVGIVERGASTAIVRRLLEQMVHDGVIGDSVRRTVLNELNRYDIQDELLFGCILDAGEYIRPVRITKNIRRRAHDRWQGVIEQIPAIRSTMIKTSHHAFPFRVEFGSSVADAEIERTMRLIYHTSLLLPQYAFPVGIDIADKFAKIPDWLSKGVSAQLAAVIYKRCVQSGDARLLEQMRNMLGRSPRDFFYRPGA
jgi:NurA domain-containing protein